uniref:Uncharacterized protein n=1 Tax=Arundo donax TaxID=35708 RepID=A0A0A8YFE3_ARUDO
MKSYQTNHFQCQHVTKQSYASGRPSCNSIFKVHLSKHISMAVKHINPTTTRTRGDFSL